jgi:hypothetical protein
MLQSTFSAAEVRLNDVLVVANSIHDEVLSQDEMFRPFVSVSSIRPNNFNGVIVSVEINRRENLS